MSEKKVPITVQEREILRKKSAQGLPDVPSLQNWTPKQFKNAITKCLFDDENSFYAYINRMSIDVDDNYLKKVDEKVYQFEEQVTDVNDFARKVFAKQVELADKNRIYFGNNNLNENERANYVGIYNKSFEQESVIVISSNGQFMKLINGEPLSEEALTLNDLVSAKAYVDNLTANSVKVNTLFDSTNAINKLGTTSVKTLLDATEAVTKVKTPTTPSEATNKQYVDNQIDNAQIDVDQQFTEINNKLVEVDNKFTNVDKQITDVDSKFSDYIPTTEKGANNGVATLGSDGKIPSGQLPTIKTTDVVANDTTSEATTELSRLKVGDTNYKVVDENKVNELVKNKLSSVMVYKGSKPTFNDLPKEKNNIGDFYNVLDTGLNYAWDGDKWDEIGGSIGGGVTPAQLEEGLAKKLDKVTEQEKLYATDNQSHQTTIQYNVEPYGNDIVKRTSEGRVKTTTPTENNDATNKEYVDNELSASVLHNKFQGDGTVTVDLAEDNQHIEVHLDQAFKESLATKEFTNTTYATKEALNDYALNSALNDYATKKFVQDSYMLKHHYYTDIHTIEFFNFISNDELLKKGELFSIKTPTETPQEAINRGFPALQSGTILYGFFFNGQDESPIVIMCDKGMYKITDGTSQTTCIQIGGNGDVVTLTNPSTATNGNITSNQLKILQASDKNYIMFNNEIFLLMDKTHTADTMTYSHLGYENNKHLVKTISITISTLAWTLNKTEIGSGGGDITQATETTLGGIKAKAKSSTDIQEVKIDPTSGFLYVSPSDSAQVETNRLAIETLKTEKQDKIIAGTNITIGADGKTINASGGITDSVVEVEELPQVDYFTPNVVYAVGKGIDTNYFIRKNKKEVSILNNSYRWKAIPLNRTDFLKRWDEGWYKNGEYTFNVQVALGSTSKVETGLKIVNNFTKNQCSFGTTDSVIFGYGLPNANEITTEITGATTPMRIVDDSNLTETERELLKKFLSVWATTEEQLQTPTITIVGNRAEWDTIPNAVSYDLYIDSAKQGSVATNSVQLDSLEHWDIVPKGKHIFKVQAKGNGYTPSDFGSVEFTKEA